MHNIRVLTVAVLAAEPTLRLTVMTGDIGHANTVTAAHVSELAEPGPWLQGGEVLMTIGLMLPDGLEAHRRYVAHLRQAAVVGLVLGLGPGLPHQRAPATLIQAAREQGLPLMELPDPIPFIAVTKWVFAQLAEQERQDLQETVDASRALTSAAVSPDPLPMMLSVWHQTMETSAVVVDLAGNKLAAAGPLAGRLAERGAHFADRITRVGLRSSSWPRGDSRLNVDAYPLGSQQVRGVLLLERSALGRRRDMTSVLVSLLSLQLEHQFTADLPTRIRRAQVLGQLLRPGLRLDVAERLVEGIGLAPADSYRVVIVRPLPEDDLDDLAASLIVAFPGALARPRPSGVELLVTRSDQGVMAALRRVVEGRPTGIGTAGPLNQLSASARQAHALLALSAHAGRPVQVENGGISRLLLEWGAPEVLTAYSGAILAPLDELPEPERFELLETLREWLQANGAWETAAHRLGVHRNTVRNRIARVAAVTGRVLDQGDERFELWLALRSRWVSAGGERATDAGPTP